MGHEWKPVGATSVNRDGYTVIKIWHRPAVWVLAHRWAMEVKLGRRLTREECVHHTCDDKTCYDPAHLELTTRSAHQTHHATGKKQPRAQVEQRLKLAAEYWDRPGQRESHGELIRRLWQSPEYRAKMSASRKVGWMKRRASGKPHNAVGRKDSIEVILRRSQSLSAYWKANRARAQDIARRREKKKREARTAQSA